MKSIISIAVLAITAISASAQAWTETDHNRGWVFKTKPLNGNVLQLPTLSGMKFPTFITTPASNLTGKTLSTVVTIVGNSPIHFFGQISGWNNCPTPANVHLYFSTRAVYDVNESSTPGGDSQYWWSSAGAIMVDNTTATITAQIDPSKWSNGLGKMGDTLPAEFWSAVNGAVTVGMSLGGGCFYDVGVWADGPTSLTINSFTVQ